MIAFEYLAKLKHSEIAGVLALVPAVSLVSFYFISRSTEPDELQKVVGFAFLGIPPLIAFLATLYFLISKYSYAFSVSISMFAWLLAASIFYFMSKR